MGLYGNLVNTGSDERLGTQYTDGRRIGRSADHQREALSSLSGWHCDHPDVRARFVQLYQCLFPSRGDHG
ncbi:hypothetical protein FHW67_003848 [Herbaspirillum sp. Sphag1AN]|uniref:hypothetical protein n=1 Tax=unclassified Herbaspirillum TaxID=2624150 RepID=UPI0016155525|nr:MULTISPECIES: hypothetical protein [unclassified Herbaspirillum]MBB3214530.1 hypothetical protein [Herbaspirillum sp. Sphag1AN]MBB3247630.1 hypothetical protein [Herbaspirillum sp. Sphag64]